MRAQKKLLGKMANKNVAKMFIDDTSAALLDDVNRFIKTNASSKKESDKIVKYIIKLVVKMSILEKNKAFDVNDLKRIEIFKQQFASLTKTLISFHTVAYSYDRQFLVSSLNKCRDLLNLVISKHLSSKSLSRSEQVFTFFLQPEILDRLFSSTDENAIDLRTRIIDSIEKLIEQHEKEK
ncbi:Tumor necrosis factor alpha-induced protein 8-like protein 1 [Halotydeus destructor]|nr:Tumor necrosis factor alpha-induced protein 8-like protein 1 [Halotydeus destructor]